MTHSPILGCIQHGFAERAYSGIFETAHGSFTTRSNANATQSSGFTRSASSSSVENGIASDENSPKMVAKNARPSSLYRRLRTPHYRDHSCRCILVSHTFWSDLSMMLLIVSAVFFAPPKSPTRKFVLRVPAQRLPPRRGEGRNGLRFFSGMTVHTRGRSPPRLNAAASPGVRGVRRRFRGPSASRRPRRGRSSLR